MSQKTNREIFVEAHKIDFFLWLFFNSFLSLLFCTAPLLFRREGQKERRFVTLYLCFQTQLIIFKSLIWKLISYNIILKAFRSNWGAFFTYFKTSAINVFIDNENFNFPLMKQGHVKNNIASETKVKKKHIWPFFSKEHPSYNTLAKVRKHKFFHKGKYIRAHSTGSKVSITLQYSITTKTTLSWQLNCNSK